MRIDRQLPFGLNNGHEYSSRSRIDFLNFHPLMLRKTLEYGNRQIQFAAKVGTKKGKDGFNVFRIADVHSDDILTLSRHQPEIRLK